MKKFNSFLMLLLLAAALIPAALPAYDVHAQEGTEIEEIQPDAAAGKDSQIVSSSPGTNYGTATNFGVGESNAGSYVTRSLIEFDLSTLPVDAEVVSATLSLWVDVDQSDNARTMYVYPVTSTWVETTVKWTSHNAAYDNGTTIGSKALANDLAAGTRVDIDLDPAEIQEIIRENENLYGFFLKMDTETNDRYLFRSSDHATAAERPMLTIEYWPDSVPPDIDWQCVNSVSPFNDGAYQCPTPNNPLSPFIDSNIHSCENCVGHYMDALLMQCEGYPNCKNDWPIYYRIEYQFDWEKHVSGGGSHTATYHVEIIINGGDTIEYSGPCGSSSTGGSCQGVVSGTIDAEDMPALSKPYDIGNRFSLTWDPGLWPMDVENTWSVYYSLQPFGESCADTYMVPVPDTYTIDPTIETPVGTPDDDQLYVTVPDQIYMVRVQDGPWNDGVDDRYDTAVSVDGSTWVTLNEFSMDALCVDVDPTNEWWLTIYFTATTEEFYIRVNDTAGNFGDNTNSMATPIQYAIGIAFANPVVPCSAQFTYDPVEDWISSVNIVSTNPGTLATASADDLIPGDWYGVEVASGTWSDNGGADRTDMEFMFNGDVVYGSESWYDLTPGSSFVWCQTEDGLITFVQAVDDDLNLRVNDQDSNWTNNTGTLSVNIYHTTFTRVPTGCELQYGLGALVSHDSVQGNQANGKLFAMSFSSGDIVYSYGLTPGGIYILDTVEGPWWTTWTGGEKTASTYYYDMEIKTGSGAWQDLDEWTSATCIIPTDSLGHLRVIFEIPADTGVEYYLRVNSTSFPVSRGYMAWDLYQGIDYNVSTPVSECDYTFDPDAPRMIGEIDSRASDGEWISGLSAGQGAFYAIQIESVETSWREDNSSPEQDALQLTTDDVTWADLPDAPGVLCYYETPGEDELVFFIRPVNGQIWKMRTDSTTFSNNIGAEGYTVFDAVAGEGVDPWTSCIDDYPAALPAINPHEWIPVDKAEGILITSEAMYAEYNGLLPEGADLPPEIWQDPDASGNYIIEIEYGTGPWYDNESEDGSFDAQLSKDGGETWATLDGQNTDVVCATEDQLGVYWKALIHVETGDVWRIRVADTETETFDDNSGNLGYVLYTAGGFEVPPADNSNIGAINVQGGGDVCTIAPMIPSTLEVTDIDDLGNYFGGWIDYLNLSILRYMAWCPRHTDILLNIPNSLKKKEPFATMDELDSMADDLKRELHGYDWGGEGPVDFSFIWGTKTPGQIDALLHEYMLDTRDDNPWDGGDLVDLENEVDMPSFYYSCQEYLSEYSGFAKGVCFPAAWMIETSAQFWIQLIFDVGFAFMCLGIILDGIADVLTLLTGIPFKKGQNLWVKLSGDIAGGDFLK